MEYLHLSFWPLSSNPVLSLLLAPVKLKESVYAQSILHPKMILEFSAADLPLEHLKISLKAYISSLLLG